MSPTATRTAARPTVSVGGAALSERVAASLRRTVVDTDIDGADTCRLTFEDPARTLLVDAGLDLGAEVTVTAGRTGEETGDRVFDGVVYAIGLDYDERGSRTLVTAYDRSYRLYTGLHTRSYQDVTDADVARTVARDAGLRVGRIEATTVVHPHVSQVNETYIDFLTRRARETNNVVLVTGDELSFGPRRPADDAPEPGSFGSRDRLQLVPGGNLVRLTVRVSAAQQVREVEVRGWDPGAKAAVVGTAQGQSRTASLPRTSAQVADLFGGPRAVTVDLPLAQQAECDAVALAHAEHLASACVHAEGDAEGDPRILAGTAVSLGATGGRFDGKVTVTRATHTWDERGYRTHVVAAGAHDRSVLGLLRGADTADRSRAGGVVVALVTNTADPERLARVKVRFPWLDEDYESDWVRVLSLGAGADRGLQLLPEVDDEVLVGFEHGDSRRPYVLGGLFNGVDAPPRPGAVASSGEVDQRVWRSRTGHEVALVDTAGGEQVEIRTAQDKVVLVLSASAGTLRVTTEGDVTVDAGGAATVTAGGDLTLSASGTAKVSGQQGLQLESSGQVTIRGSVIKLN